MLADEIKSGESINIEFKVEVPKKSEKYIKSVIAFANTAGGKIVIEIYQGANRPYYIKLKKVVQKFATDVLRKCLVG